MATTTMAAQGKGASPAPSRAPSSAAAPAVGTASADELIAQMAGEEIDRLLGEERADAELLEGDVPALDAVAVDTELLAELEKAPAGAVLEAGGDRKGPAAASAATAESESIEREVIDNEVMDAVLKAAGDGELPADPLADPVAAEPEVTDSTKGAEEVTGEMEAEEASSEEAGDEAADEVLAESPAEARTEMPAEAPAQAAAEAPTAPSADGERASDAAEVMGEELGEATEGEAAAEAGGETGGETEELPLLAEQIPPDPESVPEVAPEVVAAFDEAEAKAPPIHAPLEGEEDEPQNQFVSERPLPIAKPSKCTWVGPPFLTAMDEWKPEIPDDVLADLPDLPPGWLAPLLMPLVWVNRPFEQLSPSARNALGVLGLFTLFNAAVAVAYCVFFKH